MPARRSARVCVCGGGGGHTTRERRADAAASACLCLARRLHATLTAVQHCLGTSWYEGCLLQPRDDLAVVELAELLELGVGAVELPLGPEHLIPCWVDDVLTRILRRR